MILLAARVGVQVGSSETIAAETIAGPEVSFAVAAERRLGTKGDLDRGISRRIQALNVSIA